MRRTLSTLPAVQEAKEVYGKRKPQDSAIAAQTKRQRRVVAISVFKFISMFYK